MKILVGFTLLLTCFFLGQTDSVSLSLEEQVLVDQLMPFQDTIRVGFANTLFGKNIHPKPKAELTCTLCRTVLFQVIGWIRQGVETEVIRTRIQDLCKTLNIVSPPTCDSIVNTYLDVCLQIFHDREWLTRIDVCGIVMGGTTDRDCRAVNESMLSWFIDINDDKPDLVELPYLPEDIPTTKVIHLADIHLDLHYAVGSLAQCGDYMCCRASANDDPSNSSISAGHWGDYRDCDQPIHAVEAILHDAATRHPDADFVIMTGDLTHHQIWNYTKEDNLDHYHGVFDILRREFGNKTIYPVVGNHESVPSNLFPTREITGQMPEHNISWVYNALADNFAQFLTPSALETFRASGYYTLVHKPGFRIISINTNFCYTMNFWLLHSPQDPEGQLQWLSDRLYEAEQNREKVWIIGHVPPGSDDCWYFWGQKFNALVNRYEAIIQAQYYGHTHNDELRIFFDMDKEPPRPTGSLYISTSVTPYSYLNPGYKVFYADGVTTEDRNATWEVVDHEAYIYNVTDANLRGASEQPVIFKEYSARQMYGLRSLRPADLYELVERMARDDETFQKYYSLFQMNYDGRADCSTVACKMEFLCDVVKTDYSTVNCERLEAIMKESYRN